MVPVGQHMANLRRKGGLDKGQERAAARAATGRDRPRVADSVLLVEGPSDHFLVPHLACTLSLQWGFDKQGAAIAKGAGKGKGKGKGKGGIARYRNFFRRFEMRVAVLANPDAVLDEFDKLGAVSECHELRDRVVARVNLLAKTGGGAALAVADGDEGAVHDPQPFDCFWEAGRLQREQRTEPLDPPAHGRR